MLQDKINLEYNRLLEKLRSIFSELMKETNKFYWIQRIPNNFIPDLAVIKCLKKNITEYRRELHIVKWVKSKSVGALKDQLRRENAKLNRVWSNSRLRELNKDEIINRIIFLENKLKLIQEKENQKNLLL